MNKPATSTFRGNKASLPQKPCLHCGRPMVWRKRWARNWSEVKFCSERCRRAAPPQAGTGLAAGPVMDEPT